MSDDGRMRCEVCEQPAQVFQPGMLATRELFLLVREQPCRGWCLEHARLAGWPWLRSEAAVTA